MMKKYAATAGAVAAGLTALVGLSVAGAAPAHASGCTYYTHVQNADWLRVHTKPGLSTSVVGQLPDGAQFCYITNSAGQIQGATADGIYWEYGYGYNGSTKLTGWVDAAYLAHP